MRFLVPFLLFLPSFVYAAEKLPSIGGLTYSIEPVAGFDTVYRNTPAPHTTTRDLYGTRIIVGVDLLSVEGEYSKTNDTETYSTAPQTIINSDELIKLGLRSTVRLGNYFFFTLRAGSQMDNNTNDTTSNGSVTHTLTTTTNTYGGANIGLQFGSVFSLAVGSTVVFLNPNDFSKCEYQNTVAINFAVRTK